MSILKMQSDGTCGCQRCLADRKRKDIRNNMSEHDETMEVLGWLFAIPMVMGGVLAAVVLLTGAFQ